jgi:hypothetical protein
MGYSKVDELAINTIRTLAVSTEACPTITLCFSRGRKMEDMSTITDEDCFKS